MTHIYTVYKRPTSEQNIYTVWDWRVEKIFHANDNEKIDGTAILISDTIDFKTKAINREKEGHFIILKGIIHQEDITLVNIEAPNIGAPKYIRVILEVV